MKNQVLFSLKNNKNYSRLSSAAVLIGKVTREGQNLLVLGRCLLHTVYLCSLVKIS